MERLLSTNGAEVTVSLKRSLRGKNFLPPSRKECFLRAQLCSAAHLASGDGGLLRDKRARGDHGALLDRDPVQQRAAHAHKGLVLDSARVQDGVVACNSRRRR